MLARLTHHGQPEPIRQQPIYPFLTVMKNRLFSWAFAVPVVCGSIVGATAADYFISAESVVNAINAQCSTQYEKLDYLRIGQTAMLRMCETRQKRIDIH